MAASKKKVRASRGKRARVADSMPSEMRAAMSGGGLAPMQRSQPQLPPNSAAQDWFATLADTDNDKLYEYAYEHPTDPAKNRTAYFKRETALERNAYVMDFAENRLTIGALKCVFLRLRDEKGDRVFTSQEQYQWLLDNAMGSELEEIGTAIFASERDAEMTLDDAKNG